MTWEELNKDNIEEIKNLYKEYIQDHSKYEYRAEMKSFEDFLNEDLTLCRRCNTVIYVEEELCDCCKND